MSAVPDAMVVTGEDGLITEFSHAAQIMFGYSLEDVLGRNVSLLTTKRDASKHDGYMHNYLQSGERRIIGLGRIVYAKKADGTEFPIFLHIGEARIDGQSVFTGFIRDLSEQQALELRLAEMRADLTNFTRLSAVGTMASALAHELNQPLTAIANYLEASRDLLDAPDDKAPSREAIMMAQEALSAAANQSVRAGKIVRKLRDYVSDGQIAASDVALEPLLTDAVALVRGHSEGGNVHISVSTDTEIGDVHVDRIQIQQVIVNLLKNAFEALDAVDQPRVEITAKFEDEFVSVRVLDNGPGVSADISAQLFRPFTSSKTKGMGLGLSICRTIIEAHGGKIWCDTDVQSGTCFQFTLPASMKKNDHDR